MKLSNLTKITLQIISLTHDIIVSLFLTDDHALLIASHVLAGPTLVQRLRRRTAAKQTCAVLLKVENERQHVK